jgi:hypothetical protein
MNKSIKSNDDFLNFDILINEFKNRKIKIDSDDYLKDLESHMNDLFKSISITNTNKTFNKVTQ